MNLTLLWSLALKGTIDILAVALVALGAAQEFGSQSTHRVAGWSHRPDHSARDLYRLAEVADRN